MPRYTAPQPATERKTPERFLYRLRRSLAISPEAGNLFAPHPSNGQGMSGIIVTEKTFNTVLEPFPQPVLKP